MKNLQALNLCTQVSPASWHATRALVTGRVRTRPVANVQYRRVRASSRRRRSAVGFEPTNSHTHVQLTLCTCISVSTRRACRVSRSTHLLCANNNRLVPKLVTQGWGYKWWIEWEWRIAWAQTTCTTLPTANVSTSGGLTPMQTVRRVHIKGKHPLTIYSADDHVHVRV